jgi:hypothetical protein
MLFYLPFKPESTDDGLAFADAAWTRVNVDFPQNCVVLTLEAKTSESWRRIAFRRIYVHVGHLDVGSLEMQTNTNNG